MLSHNNTNHRQETLADMWAQGEALKALSHRWISARQSLLHSIPAALVLVLYFSCPSVYVLVLYEPRAVNSYTLSASVRGSEHI